jgi:putative Holliday junction resolvase
VKANRILAIDYGRKRIGLAISDELRLTAQPLGTVTRTNRRDNLRRLRNVCVEHRVCRIIVGHPLHMNGDAGEMANEAALFADRLKKETGIDVELIDERLTSWAAGQMLTEMELSRTARKGKPLDDVAAALLLREYLERDEQRSEEKD